MNRGAVREQQEMEPPLGRIGEADSIALSATLLAIEMLDKSSGRRLS